MPKPRLVGQPSYMQPGAFDPLGTPKPAPFKMPEAGSGIAVHSGQSSIGFQSIAPTAPDLAPKSASSAGAPLADWALKGVQSRGANPADFAMAGNQLISAKPMSRDTYESELARSRAANPQVVAPDAPAAQAARPGISVYRGTDRTRYLTGVPQGPQGQGSGDPMRDSLDETLRYWQTAGDEVGEIQNNTQAAIRSIQEYEQRNSQLGHMNAQAKALDPNAPLGMLKQIVADPQLRAFYGAIQKADPEALRLVPSAPSPGEPAVHAGNLGEFFGRHENEVMAGHLGNEETSLLDKLRGVRDIPGVNVPGHPNHEAIQLWVNSQYADPRDWEEETYVPPDPAESGIPGFLRGVVGAAGAMGHHLFGEGTSLGTGPGWQKNFDQRTEQQALMRRIGLKPPGQ